MVLSNTQNMDCFKASEAARLAGFSSPLMLNYLERSEVFERENVRQKHHGKARAYTYRDIVILRAINRLLELGARPKRIQQALKKFNEIQGLPIDSNSLMKFAKASSFFVVTQEDVIYCRSEKELISLSKSGQLAFSFMVSGGSSFHEMAKTAIKYSTLLAQGRPRNMATLNRCATECGLGVSSYASG